MTRSSKIVFGFVSCVVLVKIYDHVNPEHYPVTTSPALLYGNTSSRNATREKLIVIPIFPLITDSRYNKSNFNYPDKLDERMKDFMESLQKTLKHEFVQGVHLLYDQDDMPDYVTSRLGYSTKLKFIKVDNAYNASRVLEYVHKHYIDQLVMITNGDIYPGKGFAHIDYDVMKAKHLFYTPSRHGGQEKRCRMPPDMCDRRGHYVGAHDTYIFIPTKPFPQEGLLYLKNNNWDSLGTENVMLYIYNNTLGYKVLNPCKLIFIYHNHCSQVRHNDRKRVQVRHFVVEPSDQLQ